MTTLTENTTLKEVLQNKINHKINEGLEKSLPTLDKIQNESSLLRDYLVPTRKMKFASGNNTVKMFLGESDNGLNLNKHSISQLTERFKLPVSYVKDLATSGIDWRTNLATKILNEHATNTSNKKLLVRNVGDEIKGILSDSYMRIDSMQLYSDFFYGLKKVGAELYRADISEDGLKVYFEALYREIIELETEKGTIHIAIGVRLSNSDYGSGALDLRSYLLQPVCLNGLVTENTFRRIHSGKTISDNIEYSKKTILLDTMAQSSKMQDLLMSSFDRTNILDKLTKIKKAVDTPVRYEDEVIKLEKKGLLKEESKQLNEVLVANRVEDGIGQIEGVNLWKLAQGLGAVARDKGISRKRELEELAGSLI
jgi:hypothetical protein